MQENTEQKGASLPEDAARTPGIQNAGMQIAARGRFWAVHDRHGQLVCVTVYKKGAREVVRRLSLVPRNKPPRKASAPARWAAPSTRKRLSRSRHVPARATGHEPSTQRNVIEKGQQDHGTCHASDDLHL